MAEAIHNQKLRGRVEFSEEIIDRVLDELRDGRSLSAISRESWAPARSTFLLWKKEDRNGLSDRYAQARKMGWEKLADELIEIADDGTNDWMSRETKDGEIAVVNSEHIQRSKLRIDTRKWVLSKMLPKLYGEKPEADQQFDPQPIQFNVILASKKTPEALARANGSQR